MPRVNEVEVYRDIPRNQVVVSERTRTSEGCSVLTIGRFCSLTRERMGTEIELSCPLELEGSR